jgi:replication factor C subunit 3/5
MHNQTTPWVEKYRPTKFTEIVLEKYNKILFDNILLTNSFPNLLLYGPPGTGKTTTIINIINSYQTNNNSLDKSLVIHLNASDERGIDIIRNNINSFVNSKSLFKKGMKFVILDEVDYMTKNAQQALKYLLNSQPNDVRFCLICNYISRIDESLQNEFVRVRFNQLPSNKIITFLNKISLNENLNYSNNQLQSIQNLFNSDMRSMINYMQSNQHNIDNIETFDNNTWENLLELCKLDLHKSINYITILSKKHNIDPKNIIKIFINYIIRYKNNILNSKLIDTFQNIFHIKDNEKTYSDVYFFCELHTTLQS